MIVKSLGSILKRLVNLGVSVTESQIELLKWRLSDEAKDYYTKQENRQFYKELKKGNLETVDAIRKEKQHKIEKLKNSLVTIIILICSLSLVGCLRMPKQIDKSYDAQSLKFSDQTFEFNNQNIRLSGSIKSTRFDGDWIVVSKDFIKTFNENQDALIESLTQQKNIKNKLEIYKMISMASVGGLIVLLIICIILIAFRKRN